MKDLYPLRGIVTVLNTPFTNNDTIDLSALKENVRIAMDAGVAGFLVPAMASEVQKLTFREKLMMVETVLETANGKIPVFAGTVSASVSESGELIKAYQKLGCEHFLVQLPFQTNKQFRSDFLRLVELGPKIIMLQDWDANGDGLPDELILDLFENVPAFRCLKIETVPAGVKYSRIQELTQGRMNVSGGWAVTQMIEGLQRGVHAFMPTEMHRIYCKIYHDYRDGNIDQAKALFNEILPVLAFSNQHLDISLHFFKRLLWKQGIYRTPNVREPIRGFDQIHEKIADDLIDLVNEIEEGIRLTRR